MPLALSATSRSTYFVDGNLSLSLRFRARSFAPLTWSKSGIRYVSTRWSIRLTRRDPASDRSLWQDLPRTCVFTFRARTRLVDTENRKLTLGSRHLLVVGCGKQKLSLGCCLDAEATRTDSDSLSRNYHRPNRPTEAENIK